MPSPELGQSSLLQDFVENRYIKADSNESLVSGDILLGEALGERFSDRDASIDKLHQLTASLIRCADEFEKATKC